MQGGWILAGTSTALLRASVELKSVTLVIRQLYAYGFALGFAGFSAVNTRVDPVTCMSRHL